MNSKTQTGLPAAGAASSIPEAVHRLPNLRNPITFKRLKPASHSVLPHRKAWLLPAVCFALLAVSANAQSVSSFGTVQAGATAVVQLIRIIGGIIGVAALVFGCFRLFGGDMVRGLMGVFGAILALLIAANAQGIVNGFYSTTG